jgi:hypothetical protein
MMSMRFKSPANPDLAAAAPADTHQTLPQRRGRARGTGSPRSRLPRGAIGGLVLLTAATAANYPTPTLARDQGNSQAKVTLTAQASTVATAARQTLTGTAGLAERFVYSDLAQANGSILGFTLGEDLLDVVALLAALGYQGTDPFADGTLILTARRGSLYVSVDPDGRARPQRAVTLSRLDGLAANAMDPARDVRWRRNGSGAPQVPWMQIAIYNNDPNYNLYPVLTTGTSGSDLWLRAWFGITKKEADQAAAAGKPYYPKPNNFRLYINPTGTGIAPGQSIVLRLPLITQLVPDAAIDPQAPDQYADWWGGGRVELFAAPVATGEPPPELTALYTSKPGQTEIPAATLPTDALAPQCAACQQPLQMFKDTQGVFKNNAPSQLTEYTLGTVNQGNDPPTLGTYSGAVDIDVSYVDTAYLPAAIAPLNPGVSSLNQVGYVGTPQPIDQFKAALERFIAAGSPYAGWPQFLSDGTRDPVLKLASTAHAVAGDPDLTPPATWTPITALNTNWYACLQQTNPTPICQDILSVRQLFTANYDNYQSIFASQPSCNQTLGPVALTEPLMIAHVYGFTPFGENCSDPTINLLEDTPGYADNNSAGFKVVKETFDDLQYSPDGSFNPYVLLIHGADYIDAPNVYAYSVDDAVGNLQADGNGFVIAVGGTNGLPNPNPASPPVNVNFGSASPFGEWIKYGVCTTDPGQMKDVNPDYLSIAFYVQQENLAQCPISLLAQWSPGGEQVVYSFQLKTLDFPKGSNSLDPATHAPIDCSGLGTIQANLCASIFAYAETNPGRGPDVRTVIVPGVYPHGTGTAPGSQRRGR